MTDREWMNMALNALGQYGRHHSYCQLTKYRGGRPTKGGGYECNYDGTWYPINSTPGCNCGFEQVCADLSKSMEEAQ